MICSEDKSFRSMWSSFTWENKIGVNTNLTSLPLLIRRIADVTHMKIVSDFDENSTSDFMAANLYVWIEIGFDFVGSFLVW